MSHRRAKKVRKQMFQAGLSIGAQPYSQVYMGYDSYGRARYQVVASKGRRLYQLNKRKAKNGKEK